MAKAVITEVTIWNEAYEARYYSGATKKGNIDEMPKTVKTWMEKNPEKVNDYRTEATEEPKATEAEQEPEAEATEQKPEKPEAMEQVEEPEEAKNLPVIAEAGTMAAIKQPIAFEGYGAVEVVMFGVCMTFAFIWWTARGIAEIILATLSMLVYRLWTDREQIAEGIRKAVFIAAEHTARTCGRIAKAVYNTACNLPTVRNVKSVSVIVRLIIAIVGLAIMAI